MNSYRSELHAAILKGKKLYFTRDWFNETSLRPCYLVILEKWQRKVTTSMESRSPLEAFAGNQSVSFP